MDEIYAIRDAELRRGCFSPDITIDLVMAYRRGVLKFWPNHTPQTTAAAPVHEALSTPLNVVESQPVPTNSAHPTLAETLSATQGNAQRVLELVGA